MGSYKGPGWSESSLGASESSLGACHFVGFVMLRLKRFLIYRIFMAFSHTYLNQDVLALWRKPESNKTTGPRQANLVLIACASSEGSGEPAHPRSLARTFAARSYKQWVKRNLQTESQIPGPSEWLGMRSWNLSWRNARRHKLAWRGSNHKCRTWLSIWAPPSEFVSSSIPSWQISTAHAQPFRGATDLAFCLKVPLDSLLVWASSEGSGETARMRRLAWTFAARIGDK